jgi:hypothetical protein
MILPKIGLPFSHFFHIFLYIHLVLSGPSFVKLKILSCHTTLSLSIA